MLDKNMFIVFLDSLLEGIAFATISQIEDKSI